MTAIQHFRVNANVLATTAAELFVGAGLAPEDAETAVQALIAASLRGVDTHGLANMLPGYLKDLREGTARADAHVSVVRESAATLTLDGGQALGVVAAHAAMRMAITKAAGAGVSAVTLGNSRHLAMASYFAMMALEHDMIGVCTSASGPYVVPTFAREPRLGTNPIAVAIPCDEKPPYVFDAATSAIAGNRINIAFHAGEQLPGGVLADSEGRPIREATYPMPSYDGIRLLPLGSERATGSHKGTGLATIVEIFGSLLSASDILLRLPHGHAHHFFMALDIAAFSELSLFKRAMDDLIQTMNDTPPAPGHERVLVAGQLEAEAFVDRTAHGIPVPNSSVQWFDEECELLGIMTLSDRQTNA